MFNNFRKQRTLRIKCNFCNKFFKPGNRPDGMPNGVGFITKDGKTINACYKCICKMGGENALPRM